MPRAYTAEDHRDQQLALQPPGLALPTDPDSTWAQLLLALAGEDERITARALQLIDEADPRTTFELLPDLEEEFGLPDECTPGTFQSIERRREALIDRMTNRGGQTPAYFKQVAENLGFPDAEIVEYRPHSVETSVDGPLYHEPWAYAWKMRVPTPDLKQISVDSSVDAPIGKSAPTGRLECVIRKRAPAHTTVIFEYT